MADIVAPLGLSADVHDALCDGGGQLGEMLHLTESCESGDLGALTANLEKLPGLNAKLLNLAQTAALQWANSITESKDD